MLKLPFFEKRFHGSLAVRTTVLHVGGRCCGWVIIPKRGVFDSDFDHFAFGTDERLAFRSVCGTPGHAEDQSQGNGGDEIRFAESFHDMLVEFVC